MYILYKYINKHTQTTISSSYIFFIVIALFPNYSHKHQSIQRTIFFKKIKKSEPKIIKSVKMKVRHHI